MKKLIFIIATLFSLSVLSQGKNNTEVSVNIGAYYFHTPKAAGHNITFSGTAGIRLKEKYVISGGIDLTKAYYDSFPYIGVFGEGKRIFKNEKASPYISLRYGFGLQNNKYSGNYFSPGIGIIEHFERVDVQFGFNIKNHNHYSLRWVRGFEMRLGIIFKTIKNEK